MIKKNQIVLCTSLCFLILLGIGLTDVLGAPIKHEASDFYSDSNDDYGYKYQICYDLQGDLVYEDATGSTDYAILATGICDESNDYLTTRIITYFYVSAYYKRVNYYPHQYTQYFWDPIPSGLITWTGDIDLHTDYYRWDWTVGGQEKYSDMFSMYAEHGSNYYSSQNSINGDYRYLGYDYVKKNGIFGSVPGYTYFDALIKLQVDNDLAEDYINGVFGGVPDESGWDDYILKFHIKLVAKFQYEFWGWHTRTTQTFIFGDGTPSSDLSNIPLVLGTIEGAS